MGKGTKKALQVATKRVAELEEICTAQATTLGQVERERDNERAMVDTTRKERDDARALADTTQKERDDLRVLADTMRRERDDARVLADTMRKERDDERHRAESYASEMQLTLQRFAILGVPEDAADVVDS